MDRIGIDIERLGKSRRQHGLASWISPHRVESLGLLRPHVAPGALFLRTNALHGGTAEEIDAALDAGVDVLMLPNFRTLAEVDGFAALVAGRAEVVPLVERVEAVDLIPRFPDLGIRSFHVGLNDLALDLGATNRLGLFLNPVLARIASHAHGAALDFGIGGVARPGDGSLPVSPDLVIAQHARLGSTGAMLARSFWGPDLGHQGGVAEAIQALRKSFASWDAATEEDHRNARERLAAATLGDASQTGVAG